MATGAGLAEWEQTHGKKKAKCVLTSTGLLMEGLRQSLGPSALRSSPRLTIFNAANEKDAFAASLPGTQDVATIDVGAGGVSRDVASGGGFWTTFSQRTF
jgi:hypothetical protein